MPDREQLSNAILAISQYECLAPNFHPHGVPLRIAGPEAGESIAVSAFNRIDERVKTLARRRMQMQSKSNRSHQFFQRLRRTYSLTRLLST